MLHSTLGFTLPLGAGELQGESPSDQSSGVILQVKCAGL